MFLSARNPDDFSSLPSPPEGRLSSISKHRAPNHFVKRRSKRAHELRNNWREGREKVACFLENAEKVTLDLIEVRRAK
jgi:hypothetical protein